MSLSDDCIQHVFKNKLKLSGPLWDTDAYETISLSESAKVLELFHLQKEDIHAEKDEMAKLPKFSMNYEEAIVGNVKGKALLIQFYEQYKDTLQFNAEEFTSTIHSILSSEKSSNELQNELVEVLGFDAFELISSLLDNRDKITIEENNEVTLPAGNFSFLTDILKRGKKKNHCESFLMLCFVLFVFEKFLFLYF